MVPPGEGDQIDGLVINSSAISRGSPGDTDSISGGRPACTAGRRTCRSGTLLRDGFNTMRLLVAMDGNDLVRFTWFIGGRLKGVDGGDHARAAWVALGRRGASAVRRQGRTRRSGCRPSGIHWRREHQHVGDAAGLGGGGLSGNVAGLGADQRSHLRCKVAHQGGAPVQDVGARAELRSVVACAIANNTCFTSS
jgi:hypothetical protein